jgi:hypothetical protein
VCEQVFESGQVIRLFFAMLRSLRRRPLQVPLQVPLNILLILISQPSSEPTWLVFLALFFAFRLEILVVVAFSRFLACWGSAQSQLLLSLFALTHLLIVFILLSQPSSEPTWLVFLALFFSAHLLITYC